jgi:hypothetical protein
MIRCRTCCYPNTKPDLHFDETGECSACRNYKHRPLIDWDSRQEELLHVLDSVHGRVLVASSGGKDSTYIALRLKELGADVTTVCATTCHLTPIGRANLDNLARHVRGIEITPNMTVRAKLNRLAMELVGDPSWAEHASIHRVPFKVARDTGHHAVFYGECGPDAYGGPPGSAGKQTMTQRFVAEYGGFLGLRASDFVGMEDITALDMQDYEAPNDVELKTADVTAYFLGWFEEWDSHRNARVAAEHGMRQELPSTANWWKHENLDSAQVLLHDTFMHAKYCYGRGCAQISVDVRAGLISRDDALAWVQRNDGAFQHAYAGVSWYEILDRIGVTPERYLQLLERFTNKDIHGARRENNPDLAQAR